MSFLIKCPNCGSRSVVEFGYGGELQARPAPDATDEAWSDHNYRRDNSKGPNNEWWYHRLGCRQWLLVNRDTETNRVISTKRIDFEATTSANNWRRP